MAIFATSDHHFDHKPIIDFDGRPFADIEEMNEALISRWNWVVKPNDTVYYLGDLSFAKYPWMIDRLNGGLHLIIGNHDKTKTQQHPRWLSVQHYKEVSYEGVKFCMLHYPMESWHKMHNGSVHLHGHTHGRCATKTNRFDVGVYANGYTPVNIDEYVKKQISLY